MFLGAYETSFYVVISTLKCQENGFGVRTYHEIPDVLHKLKISEKLFKKTAT